MASYRGRYADYYDTFYANKDYAGESDFMYRVISRLSNAPPRRVLELACGTGSHALYLERLGLEIVATDLSEDMLRVARDKAARVLSRVEFRRRDMRAIDSGLGQFDAAISLFDSIGHVLDTESIAAVLCGSTFSATARRTLSVRIPALSRDVAQLRAGPGAALGDAHGEGSTHRRDIARCSCASGEYRISSH